MGKTFIQLAEVAAIIAVQFIPVPGLGITIGAAIGGAIGAGAVVGTAIATLAVAGLEAGINSLIAKSAKPATTETAIKSSQPPRISAYGRARRTGSYII